MGRRSRLGGPLEVSRGRLGSLLLTSWAVFAPCWTAFGPCKAVGSPQWRERETHGKSTNINELEPPGSLLEVLLEQLRASQGSLARLLGILGRVEAILGRPGSILGHLGAILGPSWVLFGAHCTYWRRLVTVLDAILGHLSRLGGNLGPPWGRLGALLGACW